MKDRNGLKRLIGVFSVDPSNRKGNSKYSNGCCRFDENTDNTDITFRVGIWQEQCKSLLGSNKAQQNERCKKNIESHKEERINSIEYVAVEVERNVGTEVDALANL